jgi:phage portal protein BeeE
MNKVQRLIAGWLGLKAFRSGSTYMVSGGNLISSEDNKTTYITEGYTANDIIFSIVNLITEKVRVAPWGVYTVVDESSLKKYQALMSKKNLSGEDFKQALRLKGRALEESSDPRLNELLDRPNEYCTFSDLVADSSVFKLICGGRMIYADLLKGGANMGKPNSLTILPYNLMTILAKKEFPDILISEAGYRLDDWGITDLPKESVLHDKYFNPMYDTMGSHLFGLAPMKAALLLTDKSNSANRTEAAQFQNQGPKKVIFMDDPRFTPEQGNSQAQQIKKILQGKEYGGPDNAGKTATSGYKMGVIDAGLSPTDLGIIESEKWTLRRFCNVFGGVPSQLLNDPENKSYNNQKEGEKALTTRGAFPLLNSFRENFNRKLGKDWGYKGKNIYVDYDATVYTELQDDLKEKWTWVKELPVSWRYKLELMALDAEENEGLDEIMIPSGFQPLDSYNVVDEALNDGEADKKAGK